MWINGYSTTKNEIAGTIGTDIDNSNIKYYNVMYSFQVRQSFVMSLRILIISSYTKANVFKKYILSNLDDFVDWCGICVLLDPELDAEEARRIRVEAEKSIALGGLGLTPSEIQEVLRNV